MSNISLNASMRNNLLSLQQISKLQDRTQLRLSTGLKVNSAIDNPSSYYTASALNNRADDLSALLDSMGQGIQTIKAANEGIEKATDLVNQMKAIVEQVHTSGTYVPEKEYFINEVGENGAVVSNADELRDAINSGKETICVYGKIDLGDISISGGLSLQENQKLVGVNYFGNFSDGEGFSSISATSTAVNNLIDITKTGCLISDLSLNYENTVASGSVYGINVQGTGIVADLQNLDIIVKCEDNNTNGKAAIYIQNRATANIEKKINITTSGQKSIGIYTSNNATTNIKSNANINIETSGKSGNGLHINGAYLNIYSDAIINIKTNNARALSLEFGSTINMEANASINISTTTSVPIYIYNTNVNINGNISIYAPSGRGFSIQGSANNVKFGSTASIYFNTSQAAFFNTRSNGITSNILEIASGAKLAFEKNGATKWYEVKEDYRDENTSTTTDNQITADNVETTLNVAQTSSWKTAGDIIAEREAEEAQKQAEKEEQEALTQANRETYQKQFNSALSQYDMLIKDSA